jgi:hypothetical protein
LSRPFVFREIWEIGGTQDFFNSRSRVEHIFGAQAHMGSHFTRTIGLLRAEVKIGMMNLTYNMLRLGQLLKSDGIVCVGSYLETGITTKNPQET